MLDVGRLSSPNANRSSTVANSAEDNRWFGLYESNPGSSVPINRSEYPPSSMADHSSADDKSSNHSGPFAFLTSFWSSASSNLAHNAAEEELPNDDFALGIPPPSSTSRSSFEHAVPPLSTRNDINIRSYGNNNSWKVVGSPPRRNSFERRYVTNNGTLAASVDLNSSEADQFGSANAGSASSFYEESLFPLDLENDSQSGADPTSGSRFSSVFQYNRNRTYSYSEADENPMSFLFSTSPPITLLEAMHSEGGSIHSSDSRRISDSLEEAELQRQFEQIHLDESSISSLDPSYLFGPASAPSSASHLLNGVPSDPLPINSRSGTADTQLSSSPSNYLYPANDMGSETISTSPQQLNAMSLPELGPMHGVDYYRVEFKAGRTASYYIEETKKLKFKVGDLVLVEADRGKDLGKVVDKGSQCSDREAKVIYRLAHPPEIAQLALKTQDEARALALCQNKIRQKKLPMEVVEAEYQWDRRKLTYYFIADRRIDFRELVRELFKVYKTRIWMCSVEEKALKTKK